MRREGRVGNSSLVAPLLGVSVFASTSPPGSTFARRQHLQGQIRLLEQILGLVTFPYEDVQARIGRRVRYHQRYKPLVIGFLLLVGVIASVFSLTRRDGAENVTSHLFSCWGMVFSLMSLSLALFGDLPTPWQRRQAAASFTAEVLSRENYRWIADSLQTVAPGYYFTRHSRLLDVADDMRLRNERIHRELASLPGSLPGRVRISSALTLSAGAGQT